MEGDDGRAEPWWGVIAAASHGEGRQQDQVVAGGRSRTVRAEPVKVSMADRWESGRKQRAPPSLATARDDTVCQTRGGREEGQCAFTHNGLRLRRDFQCFSLSPGHSDLSAARRAGLRLCSACLHLSLASFCGLAMRAQ